MIFFFIFFLFIRKESLLTYIEDMFRASALILLLSQVIFPESSICNDISKFFAMRTMAIIIAHNIAFHFLQNNTGLHILIFYLLWFVCVCIMSIIIDYIIRTIFKGFILILRYVKDAVFCTESK